MAQNGSVFKVNDLNLYYGNFRALKDINVEIKRNDVQDVLYDVHIEDPNELVGWQVFGGARVAGLYPAGVQVD